MAVRVLHVPRSLWAGGLKADLFLLEVALALGGLIELLHAVDLLFGSAPHLGLAGTLDLLAARLDVHEDVAHLEHRQVCVSATKFDATEMKVVTEPSPLMSGSVAYRGLRERVFADLTARL